MERKFQMGLTILSFRNFVQKRNFYHMKQECFKVSFIHAKLLGEFHGKVNRLTFCFLLMAHFRPAGAQGPSILR